MKNIQKYRGAVPATLIRVIEGDGAEVPFQEVQYVLESVEFRGTTVMKTVGKVVPLTEEERSWFERM